MSVTVSKNAGFCFGVKRATESLESAIENNENGTRLYTLGALIHNNVYNEYLERKNVGITDMSSVESLAESATQSSPVKVFVRAHGIPREDERLLVGLREKNPHFSFEDCTCPFVKKIHRIAEQYSSPENFLLLLGSPDHPEVKGIVS